MSGNAATPTISAVGRLSRCSTALSNGASARQSAPRTRALRSPTPSTTRSIATTWSGAAEIRRAPVACSPNESTLITKRAPIRAEKAPYASLPMVCAASTV